MDINLIPTLALINELLDRYDHAVFTGIKIGLKGEVDERSRYYSGSFDVCLGLCNQVSHVINKALESEEFDDKMETS